MKLAWVIALSACVSEPKAPRVEIAAPLPTAATAIATATTPDDEPHERTRLRLHARAPDRDNDGIPDDLDKCPDAPEDHDGFQDEDGCPDPDNDDDGVPDNLDNCPNTPGPAPSGCP